MRCMKRAGLAAGSVALAAVLAGCGASNGTLLSSSAATQLTFELDQASSALNAYNCQVADTALANFSDDVGQLTGVNDTLKGILSQGASRITTLAGQRCPSGASSQSTTSTASITTPTTGATTSSTSTSVTTTSSASTPSSQTSPGSGGAAPTTASTPSVTTPPAATTSTTPATSATTPDSGGAGLSDSGATSGASGLAGGSGQ